MVTGRGVALALGGAALAGTGFGFGYPELAVVGAAGLAAVAGALLLVAWRPRLSVRRSAEPDRVPRGEASLVTLQLTNTGRLRGGRMVAQDQCGHSRVLVEIPRLRPGAADTVRYPVPTERRGVLDLGPLQIERRDPFGLAGTHGSYGGSGRVWIHPRVHPVRAVPAGVTRSLDGRIDAGAHGNLTFHALREYVVGDDLRHVHWRTSAKVGDLMVREHVDTSLPRLLVLLDDRAETHTEDSFEAAAEAAASIVSAAVREQLHVSLHLVCGGGLAGSESRTPYLDRLAEATLREVADLRRAIDRFRHDRLGDTLIYLTGSGAREHLAPIGALRGVYPSIVVGLLGVDRESTAALPGVLTITAADGAEFAARWDGVRSW